MNKTRILYFLPRAMATALIIFLAIFALDVFEPGKNFTYYVVALCMHLIPNFVLAIVLVIAWKKEMLGGVLFLLISFIFTIFFRAYQNLASFFVVSLPIFLIGILFVINNRRGIKNT